jgi:hypothetical protein
MKKLVSLHAVLCMVFVVACLNTSALGQSAEDKNPLTSMTSSGSSVRWDVAGAYSSLVMTVSAPDGRVFRKEFKGGGSPEFSIDQNGERLPDGQYNYELRLSPAFSSGVKEELAKLRAKEYAPEPASEMAKAGATSESLAQNTDSADAIREMRKGGRLPAEPVVKSGSFSVMNGMVVVPGAVEGSAQPRTNEAPRPMKRGTEVSRLRNAAPDGRIAKVKQHHLILNAVPDQVIPDDLIVQGSICVGFDCVNGESFGFDTIRLKENNLRIKFEDTSVGTFPTNDWQLTANSDASGGASKFSIDDITGSKTPFTITAGAATNSIFVDSTGRMGLRTATPVLDIHVNTGNTPAIRLEQNTSQGFAGQTWDVAGNEANFFVRDVTAGSRLPFRIRPGAPTSSLDISADGNVGIGTGSPGAKLHVFGTAAADAFASFGPDPTAGPALNFGYAGASFGRSAGFFNIRPDASAVAPNPSIRFATVNVERVIITNLGRVGIGTTAPDQLLSVNGDASKVGGGSWLNFSDERLKNIKGQYNSGLKAVMQLQPLRYEYKKENALGLNSSGEHIGFGAHQLQKIIPEAVTSTSSGYLQVNNDPIIWTMLNAIKEQQKEIEQLKGEVRKLRARSHRRK